MYISAAAVLCGRDRGCGWLRAMARSVLLNRSATSTLYLRAVSTVDLRVSVTPFVALTTNCVRDLCLVRRHSLHYIFPPLLSTVFIYLFKIDIVHEVHI